jgi:hypothetical protein
MGSTLVPDPLERGPDLGPDPSRSGSGGVQIRVLCGPPEIHRTLVKSTDAKARADVRQHRIVLSVGRYDPPTSSGVITYSIGLIDGFQTD